MRMALALMMLFAPQLRMASQYSAGADSDPAAEKRCPSTKTSLQITLRRVNGGEAERLVEVSLRNVSGADLYVVTHTTRTDGTAGPYWYVDPAQRNVLVAAFVIYEPSRKVFFDHDSASARLLLLHAAETYSTRIETAPPISETVPPYPQNGTARKLPVSDAYGIRVEVAYLPASEKLQRQIASKRGGTVTGADFVEYGSSSVSIASSQCIASSSVLAFALPERP